MPGRCERFHHVVWKGGSDLILGELFAVITKWYLSEEVPRSREQER